MASEQPQKVKARVRVVIEKYLGDQIEGQEAFETIEREYEEEILLPPAAREEEL